MQLVPTSAAPTISLVALVVSVFSATVGVVALRLGGPKIKVRSHRDLVPLGPMVIGQPNFDWQVVVEIENWGRTAVKIVGVEIFYEYAPCERARDDQMPVTVEAHSMATVVVSLGRWPSRKPQPVFFEVDVRTPLKTYRCTVR